MLSYRNEQPRDVHVESQHLRHAWNIFLILVLGGHGRELHFGDRLYDARQNSK